MSQSEFVIKMRDYNNYVGFYQTSEPPAEESKFLLVLEQYGIVEAMEKAGSSSTSKEFSSQMQDKVEERPSSPAEAADCAICLERLTDKSFTNGCLHMFCFRCLLAWSKVRDLIILIIRILRLFI